MGFNQINITIWFVAFVQVCNWVIMLLALMTEDVNFPNAAILLYTRATSSAAHFYSSGSWT